MNAYHDAPKNKKTFTLLALYVGIIGACLVSGSQSIMLPVAAQEIGGKEYYSLVTTLSGCIGVVAMPLYGYLAARNPAIKSKLFAVSMLIGAVVMIARAFANSMWAIIIPGALWGVISAANYVLGYSMVREMYDAKKAGVYLGLVTTFQSAACLVGPVICGVITDTSSWRNMQHTIWPFLLLAAIFAFLGVNPKKSEFDTESKTAGAKFDSAGAFFLVVFMACLILALSMGSNFAPFGSLASNILFAAAAIGLIGLAAVIKNKGMAAFLPIGVLKDKNTLCMAGSCLFTNMSNMAAFYFIPMFVIYVLQESATISSVTSALMNIPGIFMGPIFGRWIAKKANIRPVYLAATVYRAIITLCFIFLLNSSTPVWVLYVLMFLAGFYSSSAGPIFAIGPQTQIDAGIRVQANSIVQVCQNFGGSIGAAIYTLVIGAMGAAGGMKTAFWLAFGFAVIAFICGLPIKKLDNSEA